MNNPPFVSSFVCLRQTSTAARCSDIKPQRAGPACSVSRPARLLIGSDEMPASIRRAWLHCKLHFNFSIFLRFSPPVMCDRASACSVPEAVLRLSRRDHTLEVIVLFDGQHTDAELVELADCLLAHPDAVTTVFLDHNRLTDETGVKLARYLAASTTVKSLSLANNQFGSATYLAVAAALRVNASLRCLSMHNNQEVNQARIDAAFVEALQLNTDRPAHPWWHLYSRDQNDIDFKRLREVADQLGHPSLQLLLTLLSD